MRVLVGTDGSAAAARGVSWAGHVAGALGAQVVVAAASEPSGDGGELAADVASLLEGPWSEPARTANASVTTVVLPGDPRVALLDAVREHGANLLVLGSTGRGWFPALHLGHVAHAIAHHSPVPVVIVPPGAPVEVPRRIMVGIDGSEGSRAAVEWTAPVAGALGAEVLAVHAHMRALAGEPSGAGADLEEACRGWAAPLRSTAVEQHVVLAQGWPASAIVGLETLEGADLVVLGARGAGGFKGLRLGSIALQVLQRSAVAVAVVPPGTRE
jgi:nucleotide-binding universal stress UspA family protein